MSVCRQSRKVHDSKKAGNDPRLFSFENSQKIMKKVLTYGAPYAIITVSGGQGQQKPTDKKGNKGNEEHQGVHQSR